jgi:biopolymer transport protein ExbD
LSVNNRLAGREIRCPHCSGSISVPEKTLSAEQTSAPNSASAAIYSASEEFEPVELAESSAETDFVPAEIADDRDAFANQMDSDRPRGNGLLLGSLEQVSLELEQAQRHIEEDEDSEEISFPKKELPKDDMDMTPMVDVTFLLLIFFMITASFSKEKVFEEPPPLSDNAAMATEPPPVFDLVRVQIDEFNGYTIILPGGDEREASSKQDLLLALSDARAEVVTGANEDQLKLMIEAHVDCIHAAVVAALDAGRDKGFTNFQVQVVEEFQ